MAVVAVVVSQYRGRRTRQSVTILAIAAVLGLGILHGWTWSLRPEPVVVSSPAFPAESLPVPIVVCEVPLRTGARVSQHGSTVRIVEVVTNDPGGALIVALSESAPETSSQPWPWMGPGSSDAPASYFATGSMDGRTLEATVSRARNELSVGRVRYFRTYLVFARSAARNRDFPPDLHEWVKTATLRRSTAAGAIDAAP
jgi:hypothetical protein